MCDLGDSCQQVESYAKQSGHSHPLLPSYVIQADKGEKGDSGPRGRRGEQGEKGIKGADEKVSLL